MNKSANIIFAILGVFSIIGAVLLLWGITIFDTALNDMIKLDPSSTANLGLDFASIQQLAKQLKGLIMLGWAWCLSVVITGAALVYYSLMEFRSGRKKNL